MPPFDPHLWRLAGRLQRQIAAIPTPPTPILDQSLWLSARRAQGLRVSIARRPWRVARDKSTSQLVFALERLQNQIQHLIRGLSDESRINLPAHRFLYEELLDTREEFPGFEIDLRKNTVSVTTGEIHLEGIELGRFQIQLDILALARDTHCYRVLALTPNRAASRDDATHPHVLDDQLCEGEGTIPLQLALQAGRLSDFFLIVDRTLHTYNSESAYVSLNNWEDHTTCDCCGDRVSECDRYFCEDCEHASCDECSTSCSHCDGSACDACIQRCPHCDKRSCAACLTPCQACQRRCCPDCQTDSLCEDCHAPETNDEETPPPTTTLPADAAVQSNRVGEALVPA